MHILVTDKAHALRWLCVLQGQAQDLQVYPSCCAVTSTLMTMTISIHIHIYSSLHKSFMGFNPPAVEFVLHIYCTFT
jgi:hypothetical protein